PQERRSPSPRPGVSARRSSAKRKLGLLQKETERLIDGRSSRASERADVRRLEALRPLGDIELDFLALSEASEPLHLDSGVMTDHFLPAAILSNETVALRIVKPLHSTSCHSLLIPHVTGGKKRSLVS